MEPNTQQPNPQPDFQPNPETAGPFTHWRPGMPPNPEWRRGHRRWKALRGLKVLVFVLAGAALLSFVVMHLWNWLMPGITGWRTIGYWQALGLLLLCKILFGGFHRHAGGGRRHWKRHMEERFAHMSPEERQRFREAMRQRHGCRPFGPRGPFARPGREEAPTEQSAH